MLVVLGRVVLVAAPLLWLAVARFGPDAGRGLSLPWFLAVWTVAFLSPWLLLPVGSAATATVADGTLTVVTVLGTRRVPLDDLRRIGALTVYGRAGSRDQYVYLRGPGPRVLWLHVDDGAPVRGPVRAELVRAAMRCPGIVSARARAVLGVEPVPTRARRLAQEAFTFIAGSALLVGWWCAVVVAFLAPPV